MIKIERMKISKSKNHYYNFHTHNQKTTSTPWLYKASRSTITSLLWFLHYNNKLPNNVNYDMAFRQLAREVVDHTGKGIIRYRCEAEIDLELSEVLEVVQILQEVYCRKFFNRTAKLWSKILFE